MRRAALAIVSWGAVAGAMPAAVQAPPELGSVATRIALDDTLDFTDLDALGRAIGDRRIVLLGENGHGVCEFTLLKSRIVRYLHERKGFDVLVLEAPVFACAGAYDRLGNEPIEQSMRECLLAPFHHAELRPLFEYIAARRGSARRLQLVGSDIQLRGWGPIRRPDAFRRHLLPRAPELAARIARADSALLARQRLGVDSLRPWIAPHATELRAAYDSAAEPVDDEPRWFLRNASVLLAREMERSSDASGPSSPAFYQIRDEWMARNVLWAADSLDGAHTVIVWLHNDHARYGSLAGPSGAVRAAGSFLREWRGDDVFSVGFLHGRGRVATNSRRLVEVDELPPGSIEAALAPLPYEAFLDRRNGPPWLREWGSAEHPMLRAGLAVERWRPAAEFDALIWTRTANPPSYRLTPTSP